VASISAYTKARGWPTSPMGPIDRDSWNHWLHILSHCLEDGHSSEHAKCELQLTELAISALRQVAKNSK
jgi:hypothetical protein